MREEFPVTAGPAWCPSHPGELIRGDVLPALGLTVSAAAEHLHVSGQMLHRVLAGESAVTPEMALRLGKLCGDGASIWLAMQQAHDLWQAERAMASELERIPTLAAG